MNDITCPSCEKSFKLDEAGYADIVNQIRDREFEAELGERQALFENEKKTAIELAELKISSEKDQIIRPVRRRRFRDLRIQHESQV